MLAVGGAPGEDWPCDHQIQLHQQQECPAGLNITQGAVIVHDQFSSVQIKGYFRFARQFSVSHSFT